MEITKQKKSMKSLMWDIIVDISWANISKKYFGKSRSWLSQKMNGLDGNGSNTEFTEEEQQNLKEALYDLSNRIKICADKL
ncbi:hypothetical protein LPB03_13835 [Polaribacter vadi]|uniref:DUF5053 domain-containing protein n=1 Tax=Polaribacter vadi TaxID=1774273 RepID=A0A1B8TP55_9FLAO|nr:DUF5053 domain-containing protein [Polaribacter vadi]AOW18469.1 hypothetical protein LPB03_13835 [Polaribacter vadi]OBY61417.1 hypothetical protein LPB3_15470 [Polaribacter vadi]|tara:strand:- start:1262 stop:1504 length:243 start_codon:yes stop_codon:yes gene_type:complete